MPEPQSPKKPTREDDSRSEPFVDAAAVSKHRAVTKRQVDKWRIDGIIRGHVAYGNVRHRYRYKISEVDADMAAYEKSLAEGQPKPRASKRPKADDAK